MGLSTLPAEVWMEILQYIDSDDARDLCCTSQAFMSALQAKVYDNLIFQEDASSAGRVLAIASGPRARLVHTIVYSPRDPKPKKGWEDEDESEHDPSIALSDEADEVLRSLKRFPGLEKFRFVLDEWVLENWPGMPTSFSFEWDEHHDDEETEPWRILLAQSFDALVDSAGAFSSLELENLPPVPTEEPYDIFYTEVWQELLGGLKSFEITLSDYPDEGAGSITTAHQKFLSQLPQMFLNHLTEAEHLGIKGQEWAFIGHYGNFPIVWGRLRLPRLKSFALEYSALDKSLGSFLVRHSGLALEKIYLRRCLGEAMEDWERLCQKLAEKNPPQLVEFTVVPYPVRKRLLFETWDDWNAANWEMWTKLDAAGEMERDILDEKNAMFVVGETCESYGRIQPSPKWVEDEEDSHLYDESHIVEEWKKIASNVEKNKIHLGLSS